MSKRKRLWNAICYTIYIMLTYVYKAVPFHNYLHFSRFERKFVSK